MLPTETFGEQGQGRGADGARAQLAQIGADAKIREENRWARFTFRSLDSVTPAKLADAQEQGGTRTLKVARESALAALSLMSVTVCDASKRGGPLREFRPGSMTPRGSPYRSHHYVASGGAVEALTKSLVKSSLVLAILAVLVPGVLYALFGRQARRLDALADHGQRADATVVARREGAMFYSYTVNGTTHSWSVRDGAAPLSVGETFAVTYLPEVPSFSRPGLDRSAVAAEAASSRTFTGSVVAGVFWFFAANLIICRVRLRRLRATGRTEVDDPHAYRTRLILTGVLLLAPMLALVVGWHANDALRRNEGTWPVVLGAVLSLGVLGGTALYVLREGVGHAARRSSRLVKWTLPLVMAFALVRALAWLLSS